MRDPSTVTNTISNRPTQSYPYCTHSQPVFHARDELSGKRETKHKMLQSATERCSVTDDRNENDDDGDDTDDRGKL